MWNGKNKAVTFSYDDGITQDRRLVEIFNKYNLKCTFNLNSGIMNEKGTFQILGNSIYRMPPDDIKNLYRGHEIAVHTLTHPNLTELDNETVRREIMEDKIRLEEIFESDISGMAYPYGTFSERIIKIAGECGIRFSRTTADTHDFGIPVNLMAFGATCHHRYEGLWELLEKFLNYSGDEPAVFCLWGHSYEFDVNNNWELIEQFCEKISGKDDIFYGSNSDIYLCS